jgi:large subunit ribosomal protein L10
MARPEKVAVVDEIRTKLDEADAAVLTEYRGLTVHELAELRASLRPTGTQYKVFKNTLARLAIEGRGLDQITDLFEGPVAIAFVSGDAAAAAKALREFGRNHEALVVKGGLLGERVVSPNEIAELAELPSREVLLTQIAGLFQQPLTRAAGLFQAFPRNFAYGVKALIDQRVAGGEAAPPAESDAESEAEAPAAEAPAAEAPAEDASAEDAPAAEAQAAPVAESAEAEAPAEDAAPAAESTESE